MKKYFTYFLLSLVILSGISFAYLIKFYDKDGKHEATTDAGRNILVSIGGKNYNLDTKCDKVQYKNGYIYCLKGTEWEYGVYLDTKDINPLDGAGNLKDEIEVDITDPSNGNNTTYKEYGSGISYVSGKSRKLKGEKAENILLDSYFVTKSDDVYSRISGLDGVYLKYSDLATIKVLEKNTIIEGGKISLDNIVNYDLIEDSSSNFYTICNIGCNFSTDDIGATAALQEAVDLAKTTLVKGIFIKDGTYELTDVINITGAKIKIIGASKDTKIVAAEGKDVFNWTGNNGRLETLTIDTLTNKGNYGLKAIGISDMLVNQVTFIGNNEENKQLVYFDNSGYNKTLASTDTNSGLSYYNDDKLIKNIEFTNNTIDVSANTDALYFNLVNNLNISNNQIKGKLVVGLSKNVKVKSNNFTTQAELEPNTNVLKINGPIYNLLVEANTFNDLGTNPIVFLPNNGFDIGKTGIVEEVLIKDNEINNTKGDGILISTGDMGNLVSYKNIILNNNTINKVDNSGIILSCNSDDSITCNNIEITNNKIFDFNSISKDLTEEEFALIDDNKGNGVVVYDRNKINNTIQSVSLKITGNKFEDTKATEPLSRYGLYYDSFTTEPVFSLNEFINLKTFDKNWGNEQ